MTKRKLFKNEEYLFTTSIISILVLIGYDYAIYILILLLILPFLNISEIIKRYNIKQHSTKYKNYSSDV